MPWLKDEKLLATPMPAEWGEDRLKEARTIMVNHMPFLNVTGLFQAKSRSYLFYKYLMYPFFRLGKIGLSIST